MQELSSSGNAVFSLHLHLVLVTKYRKKVMDDAMLLRCEAIVRDVVAAWKCQVVEFNGEADHVHALLSVVPRARLSDLVGNIKTVTARRLRSEFPRLREVYWKPVFWSPSYFVMSVGGAPIEILKRYIQGQDRPIPPQ